MNHAYTLTNTANANATGGILPPDPLGKLLAPAVRSRMELSGTRAGLVCRAGGALTEERWRPFEVRSDGDTLGLAGYASVTGNAYDVAGGPPYGFTETIERGAFTKSLNERDDVRLLINHDGLPIARSASGSMRLSEDSTGLLVEVDSLDLANPTVQELASAMQRGDVDQMSFAFRVTRQEWNDDYTERTIREVKLYDVSVVTFPANPATAVGLRSDDTDTSTPAPVAARGMPLALARLQADRVTSRY